MRCGLRNSWSLESGPLISRRGVCRGGSGTSSLEYLEPYKTSSYSASGQKAAPGGVLPPSSRVLYSGPAPRDAVTFGLDPDPGLVAPAQRTPTTQQVAPARTGQFFFGRPVPNVWTTVIKACTQPFFCCPPTLRFTILPPYLVVLLFPASCAAAGSTPRAQWLPTERFLGAAPPVPHRRHVAVMPSPLLQIHSFALHPMQHLTLKTRIRAMTMGGHHAQS
jgi:hypothetical protein